MSSILKALRKLEEERARKRETAPEIATSILRVDARRKLLPLWLWPAVVVGGMLLAAAVFWGLRPTSPTPGVHVAPPAAPLPTAPRSVRADAIVEEILDTRVPAVPVAAARRTSPAPVAQPAPSRALSLGAPSSTVAPPPTVAAAPVVTVPSDPITAPPLGPSPLAPPAAAHSQPLVSAIAWQEDRASRMAVVNGLPVMEGELVGTAKVEEIQADGVVFSENGVRFSVPVR